MKDIILITADSLRSDYISYYNPDSPAQTPNLDKLAEEGAVFHTAISNGSGTVLSVPSLLTGDYKPNVSDSTPTVAELLKRQGYQTAAFTPNIQVVGPNLAYMQLDRGFDHFDTLLHTVRKKSEYGLEKAAYGIGHVSERLFGEGKIHDLIATSISYLPLPLARPTPPVDVVNQHALQWIDSELDDETPFFMWLFHLDTHEPWLPPEDYVSDRFDGFGSQYLLRGLNRKFRYFKNCMSEKELEKIQSLYTASIEYWDKEIGEFIDEVVEKRGREPLVIITSDHGELFGEHGDISHGSAPWEPLIRVPLIINGPDVPQKDESDIVQNIDVANTIIKAGGGEVPDTCRGISLLESGSDEETSRDGVMAITSAEPHDFVYHTGDWKYIKTTDDEYLFDMRDSWDEIEDVSEDYPNIHSDMSEKLDDELAKLSAGADKTKNIDGDEEIQARLRSLGYIE